MAIKLRKPILIGGIGLSLSLWLLDSLGHSLAEVGEVGVVGAIAAGAGIWWLGKQTASLPAATPQPPTDRETVVKAIAVAASTLSTLTTVAPDHPETEKLRGLLANLRPDMDREQLRITITGGKGVGKTALRQLLADVGGQINATWTETPALFTGNEGNGATPETLLPEGIVESDLVIFVITGDLTKPEYEALQQLSAGSVETLVVWNKQDQYSEAQKPVVWQQVRSWLEGTIDPQNLLVISAAPQKLKVRQHQPDGSVQESIEQPAPDISQLTERLSHILATEKQNLILGSTWRAARNLHQRSQTTINAIRREIALPIIERYQWLAAGAAFANPVPALDLLATGAITGQLVLDLGSIYQQKLSLAQGQTVAATLAEQMVKLGLVELSTQTITAILKSNSITYIAGGLVQGISAAYLTRLAGLSLIECFQAGDAGSQISGGNLELLSQAIKQVFEQNRRVDFLQSFVPKARARLIPIDN
ncbi:MAG: YcjF family protein [Oscillatoriaceae cyanobacterium]